MFAFIVPCFKSERNQERKKHCINQRSEKSFFFFFYISDLIKFSSNYSCIVFLFFEKRKDSSSSISDYGVLCLAPSLTTFYPNYTITESCVMRL